MMRRAFTLLLCAALAAAAPSALTAAEQPCEMAVELDAGTAPCDCGNGDVSGCAPACSIASAALTLASAFEEVTPLSGSEGVAAATYPYFASLTGPPVFQPPR
jgi:hypothetical protein